MGRIRYMSAVAAVVGCSSTPLTVSPNANFEGAAWNGTETDSHTCTVLYVIPSNGSSGSAWSATFADDGTGGVSFTWAGCNLDFSVSGTTATLADTPSCDSNNVVFKFISGTVSSSDSGHALSGTFTYTGTPNSGGTPCMHTVTVTATR